MGQSGEGPAVRRYVGPDLSAPGRWWSSWACSRSRHRPFALAILAAKQISGPSGALSPGLWLTRSVTQHVFGPVSGRGGGASHVGTIR